MKCLTLPAASLLILVLSLVILPRPAQAKYSGGTGEPNNPYRTGDYNDLYALADSTSDYSKHFVMTADIDLDPNLPGRRTLTTALIAPDTNSTSSGFQGTYFTGTFDGNDYNIINLVIRGEDYLGFFGYIRPGGSVRNLGLEDVNIISTGEIVGGIAGYVSGSVANCYASGTVAASGKWVGGLVGFAYYASLTDCYATGAVAGDRNVGSIAGYASGTITNCYALSAVSSNVDVGGLVGWGAAVTIANSYAKGNVSGTYYVGGLVGDCRAASVISACYASSDVNASDNYVGGLVGYMRDGNVADCYATGTINGDFGVGGLVGYNYQNTIADCYSTGAVSGGNAVGGLVGNNYRDKVLHCYSTGKPSGTSAVGGLAGSKTTGGDYEDTGNFWDTQTSETSTSAMGTGKTTAEMQTKSTFTDAGWDFNDIWAIDEGEDYPVHIWERVNLSGEWYEVDFADFSKLAQWWGHQDCAAGDDCDSADFDFSGHIDEADLRIFSTYWLTGLE